MVLSFQDYLLNESFLNLFKKDLEQRLAVAGEVWDILQASYKPIGGIHGSGFKDVQDMIDNIPFWKLVRRNGQIVTVVMYKDKEGRKMVACGTNGSKEGKEGLLEILVDDLNRERAYTEISEVLLKFLAKNVGYQTLQKYAKKFEEVKLLLPDDEVLRPSDDDPELRQHPQLADYFYQRKIKDTYHTKVMLGTSGKRVISFDDVVKSSVKT